MYIIGTHSHERESESIRHVLRAFSRECVLEPMGLGPLSWVIAEAQKPALVPGMVGDVDILAGTMDFADWDEFHDALAQEQHLNPQYPKSLKELLAGKRVSEAGGIRWPPEPAYIVGIEVKCAYFSDQPHSTKSTDKKLAGIRKQIDWLQKMGLDKFALLDVIGNTPCGGVDSRAWLGAMGRAEESRRAMAHILKTRLPECSPAGHLLWAVGSVVGGDESMRGAGAPQLLRRPVMNPALESQDEEVLNNRISLLHKVPNLLARLPKPRYFPITCLDCRKCRRIHYMDDPRCAWNRRDVEVAKGNAGQ